MLCTHCLNPVNINSEILIIILSDSCKYFTLSIEAKTHVDHNKKVNMLEIILKILLLPEERAWIIHKGAEEIYFTTCHTTFFIFWQSIDHKKYLKALESNFIKYNSYRVKNTNTSVCVCMHIRL